jgi:mutator protein MutT
MAEYWDLFNNKREFLGRTIERGTPFQEGEFYVAVEMWTINSNGKLLVTQRHPNKKAGGRWEFSGGGVSAGEPTLLAAKRELSEELGMEVENTEISLFNTYPHRNCFIDIYLIQKDIEISDLTLQEDEVIDAKWVSFDEFENMCAEDIVVRAVKTRFDHYRSELEKYIK